VVLGHADRAADAFAGFLDPQTNKTSSAVMGLSLNKSIKQSKQTLISHRIGVFFHFNYGFSLENRGGMMMVD
jgi:hypothetical protein